MKSEYDKHSDAAYFEFSTARPTRQVKLDDARIIDYAADGSVVGVEFISPSRGVDLADVPMAGEIVKAARHLGFPVVRGAAAGDSE